MAGGAATEWSDVRLKWSGFADSCDAAALLHQREGAVDDGDPLTALRSTCLMGHGSGISIFYQQPSDPSSVTRLPFTIELRLRLIDLTCTIKKTSHMKGEGERSRPLIIEYEARVLTDLQAQTVALVVDHPESAFHLRLILESSKAAGALSTVSEASSALDLKAQGSNRSTCKGTYLITSFII